MNTLIRLILTLLVIPAPALAQELFPAHGNGEAPDRMADILHYRITVGFDEPARTVHGTVSTTLVPFPSDLRRLTFDAEEMTIHSAALASGTPLSFSQQERTVTLDLDRAYGHTDTLTVTLTWSATPRKGLYFVQPDSAYPHRPRQIWTQGEDMDSHFWFPCHDFPNDRATSEIIATVERPLTVLSNGRLLSMREDTAKGTRTFHWYQGTPHVSYLIMLAIGEYTVLRDTAGRVPLEYYVYPGREEDARVCFAETPAMMRFFEEYTGTAYPWDKYAQVLIHEFVVGGMENTSATSLADDATLFDARARIDESPTSLIAHELVHQWWGDLVTCKDWRHLWLNESFASYFDPLYHEQTLGRDQFDFIMFEAQRAGINTDKTMGRKPIVSVGSYGANLYPRGASVLHMLRFLLGEDLFRRALRHYITKHRFGVVETNDLKVAIEEATGLNLYWFFDQWVYKAGYPIFAVEPRWEEASRTLFVHCRQVQTTDSLTGIFRTPVDIEVTAGSTVRTHRVWIDSRDTVFAFGAAVRPSMVIFDRGNWLLKEVQVTQPLDAWLTQADKAANPIDRLRALEHLAEVDDTASVIPAIIRRARTDPFAPVRAEAVQMLGMMTGGFGRVRPAVRQALLEAADDTDASVRIAAVPFLTDAGDTAMISLLRRRVADSSYVMVARALRALAKADPAGSRQVILDHLDMPSHRDVIASSALGALTDVDSVRSREEALKRLRYGYPQPVRSVALSILRGAALRNQIPSTVFLPVLTDRNVWLRNAAIRALGDTATDEVLPHLAPIAADPKNPSSRAAARAVEKIRSRTSTGS